jgi:hypothetical protein
MKQPDTTLSAPRGRPRTQECCGEATCDSASRNNYYDGKRLTTDSFRAEQAYQLERRRLLNRAIHGWGVVYGYRITPEAPTDNKEALQSLQIGAGLALDRCGRELLQVGKVTVDLDQVMVLDEHGDRTELAQVLKQPPSSKSMKRDVSTCWMLRVHYAELSTDHVRISDPCRCEREEWDRTCETVRYTLQQVPCERCCAEPECELKCGCGGGHCCPPEREATEEALRKHGGPPRRGGCRCLCDHVTKANGDADCGHLCEIKERCDRVRVDLHNGVELACLWMEERKEGCEGWACVKVEACGPRRLVKRNDLLFDLLRGCDLTRISAIGWADWHRAEKPIGFQQFSDAFGATARGDGHYVTKRFSVTFSRAVRAATVRADCFAMTIMFTEGEGGWWQTFRVPIVDVETSSASGDPSGHVSKATMVVEGSWVEDALRGIRTLFQGKERAGVEIEVRGDYIVDCNGLTVDGNAVGLAPAPTGNGTPGGTFLSSFRVEPAPGRSTLYERTQSTGGASS